MNYKNIKYQDITYQQLQCLCKQKNVLVLDVRTPEEHFGSIFPANSLLSSSQNLPLDEICTEELQFLLEEWWHKRRVDRGEEDSLNKEDEEINLCFICRSGIRSVQAINLLQAQMVEEGLPLNEFTINCLPKKLPVKLNYYNLAGGITLIK